MSNKRDLRAFVRFDGSGRIVAGSLILRKNKPKVGKWHEIQAYECCNYIPSSSTTTTTTTQAGPILKWRYSTIPSPEDVCISPTLVPFSFNGSTFCNSTIIYLDTTGIGENGSVFYGAYQGIARLWVVTGPNQADIFNINPTCYNVSC